MNELPVYVVSDVHLGAVPAETDRRFRAFLSEVSRSASRLVINGDLFDFWFEYRTVIPARHYRVLAALADAREAGVEIDFVGGNHDGWAGPFLRDEVGLNLLGDRSRVVLAGWRALVVHGDGVGRGDLGYRILKRVIRSPVCVHAFRALHPDWGSRIAGLASTTESKRGGEARGYSARAAELRRWAEEQLAFDGEIDLVLAGHTHTPTISEVSSGRYYVNTGDWINHATYLVLQEGKAPELREWA